MAGYSRLRQEEGARDASISRELAALKRAFPTRNWGHVNFEGGWLRLDPGETKNDEGRLHGRQILKCRSLRVGAHQPSTIVMIAVLAVAGYIPARSASRINPPAALRYA